MNQCFLLSYWSEPQSQADLYQFIAIGASGSPRLHKIAYSFLQLNLESEGRLGVLIIIDYSDSG